MIRISGSEMCAKMQESAELAEGIRGDYRALVLDLQALAGSWEGEAAASCFGKAENVLEDLLRDCTRMQILLAGVSQAMNLYETCERKIEGYVQS